MSAFTLADIDRDEVLTEAIAVLHGCTRAQMLRRTAFGAAAMLATLANPAAAQDPGDDLAVLNFALRFERLQASFYTEAEELGTIASMSERKQQWAKTLGAHERAHVRILKQVLADKAERRPRFNFGGANESDDAFTRTAVAMEDLTVAMLTGVAPVLKNRELTAAAMGLITVEARHAAWARNIVNATPSPQAFDEPRTLRSVRGAVARTRFVVSQQPRMASRRRPRFTG